MNYGYARVRSEALTAAGALKVYSELPPGSSRSPGLAQRDPDH
jgi:hypothetical protein